MRYVTESRKIRYQEALPLFKKMRNGHPAFILESSDASEKYGRLSMVGFEPILELRGKDDQCTLKLLHKRGKPFLNSAKNAFRKYHSKTKGNSLTLTIPKAAFSGEEDDRLKRINIAQIIRRLLNEYHIEEKNFMGFYGALSYNFIYLFEDIATSKQNEELDFHLFLYDNIMLFNHLTRDCSIYCTRTNKQQAKRDVISQLKRINSKAVFKIRENSLKITDLRIQPSEKEYKQQVLRAKELCKNGELMELVLSRKLSATIKGDAVQLYEDYKELNPSPYQFYFDLGDEELIGTSPEMMLRFENDKVQIRPISGTSKRGRNTIEDHLLMMELLNSSKEKSELDMLIDLGRNDLSRVCKPGVRVDNYRMVEKYSHVMHTVSEVSGELAEGQTGFDALISCLNAGTLTGAPKLAAMKYIEKIEKHSRGYYGGALGYFLLNGELNTTIIIRTAHIKNNKLSFLAGATLLHESEPADELNEIKYKSRAFLETVKNITGNYARV